MRDDAELAKRASIMLCCMKEKGSSNMKEVMTVMKPLAIFDGHNDVLLRLYLSESRDNGLFFTGSDQGHIDLPRAHVGGFGGGFFAVFVPPDPSFSKSNLTITDRGYEIRMHPPP